MSRARDKARERHRREEAWTCSKVPYDSETEAKAKLVELARLGARRCYLCSCGKWHLTSQPFKPGHHRESRR